jgi:DNA-binding transcriptional MerR regulator
VHGCQPIPYTPVRYLKTSEAAALLNVSPNTLRAWERRFGYPKPQRSPGKHRLYTHGEITALRDALHEGLSISSAVSKACEGLSADADTLVSALSALDVVRADAAMEAALAMRSVERALEDVLLPSMVDIEARYGLESAPWAAAARWASDWLFRAQRLAGNLGNGAGVLFGEATDDLLDPQLPAIRALELLCARSGLRVVSLSVRGVNGIGEAFPHDPPELVVVAGGRARDDEVARWAYAVRSNFGALPMTLYRRDVLNPIRARTTGTRLLAPAPIQAHQELADLLSGGGLGQPQVVGSEPEQVWKAERTLQA